MADSDRDILDLIESGRKIEAIKLAREHLGMGLAEAKDFVESLAADAAGGSTPTTTDDLFERHLDTLLRAKKKIAAVKLYRDRANCQLKDAKDAIELRAVELGLQSRPSKCFIATAAFGGGEQADVMTLRHFRNRVLRKWTAGRAFITFYEVVSPPVAWAVGRSEPLAAITRAGVGLLARACRGKTSHR